MVLKVRIIQRAGTADMAEDVNKACVEMAKVIKEL